MNSPFSICTRLASVLSVPVRLNNRNDRTTGTMERDIKRYRPIHLLCFAKVFFLTCRLRPDGTVSVNPHCSIVLSQTSEIGDKKGKHITYPIMYLLLYI
jgi:hypothetical protein